MNVIDKIKNRRQRILDGKLNCIPLLSFPILSNYYPGVEQAKYQLITANQKVDLNCRAIE